MYAVIASYSLIILINTSEWSPTLVTISTDDIAKEQFYMKWQEQFEKRVELFEIHGGLIKST